LLRPRPIRHHITVCNERTHVLGGRLARCYAARVNEDRKKLESLSRVLEGISYRGVLERGFALVRGADGKIRRRAEAVKSGERLSLTFADGEREAIAGGAPSAPVRPRVTKPSGNQGDLF
jgi:exodeoxyribonuclease VII large subunit